MAYQGPRVGRICGAVVELGRGDYSIGPSVAANWTLGVTNVVHVPGPRWS